MSFGQNTIDLTARDRDADALRQRLQDNRQRQRDNNIHGLTYEEARDAFADYLSVDGLVELMLVSQRDAARSMGMPVEPLAETPENWHSIYTSIKADPETTPTGRLKHSDPKPL